MLPTIEMNLRAIHLDCRRAPLAHMPLARHGGTADSNGEGLPVLNAQFGDFG